MEPSQVERATAAVTSLAAALDLPMMEMTVLQNSNKLSLRLLPCDVFARVGPTAHAHAAFEVDLARRLAEAGCPVAELEPRVAPRHHEVDGFEISLWTHHPPLDATLPPDDYAAALQRLHAGMRDLDLETQHFTRRVDEAQQIVGRVDASSSSAAADREFLAGTLRRVRRRVLARRTDEQVLHGEPHPGNVLHTADGPRFIDLETCCRGPVEFDLAHVPRNVAQRYPGLDPALLEDCRELVLGMVAAWRHDPGDQFPDGAAFGRSLVECLRNGPPWPTIDEVHADVTGG